MHQAGAAGRLREAGVPFNVRAAGRRLSPLIHNSNDDNNVVGTSLQEQVFDRK